MSKRKQRLYSTIDVRDSIHVQTSLFECDKSFTFVDRDKGETWIGTIRDAQLVLQCNSVVTRYYDEGIAWADQTNEGEFLIAVRSPTGKTDTYRHAKLYDPQSG